MLGRSKKLIATLLVVAMVVTTPGVNTFALSISDLLRMYSNVTKSIEDGGDITYRYYESFKKEKMVLLNDGEDTKDSVNTQLNTSNNENTSSGDVNSFDENNNSSNEKENKNDENKNDENKQDENKDDENKKDDNSNHDNGEDKGDVSNEKPSTSDDNSTDGNTDNKTDVTTPAASNTENDPNAPGVKHSDDTYGPKKSTSSDAEEDDEEGTKSSDEEEPEEDENKDDNKGANTDAKTDDNGTNKTDENKQDENKQDENKQDENKQNDNKQNTATSSDADEETTTTTNTTEEEGEKEIKPKKATRSNLNRRLKNRLIIEDLNTGTGDLFGTPANNEKTISEDIFVFSSTDDEPAITITPSADNCLEELGLSNYGRPIRRITTNDFDTTGMTKIDTILFSNGGTNEDGFRKIVLDYCIENYANGINYSDFIVTSENDDGSIIYATNTSDWAKANGQIGEVYEDNTTKLLYIHLTKDSEYNVYLYDDKSANIPFTMGWGSFDATINAIAYDLDGGNYATGFIPTCTYKNGDVIALPTLFDIDKDNYILDYWSIDGTKVTTIDATYTDGRVINLKLNWKPDEIAVNYYESATSDVVKKTALRAFKKDYTLDTTASWTKTGYTFAYWMDRDSFEPVTDIKACTKSTPSNLYPVWFDNSVISYDGKVIMGTYQQSDPTGATKDPVKWEILSEDKTNDQVLVITEKVLHNRLFSDSYSGRAKNYSNSPIKTWLNGDFYNSVFSAKEIDNIKGTDGNKLFLLNANEANNYFSSNSERVANGTAYTENEGAIEWWLADTYDDGIRSKYVNKSGQIINNTSEAGNKDNTCQYMRTYGVRPAMWIKTPHTEYGRQYRINWVLGEGKWKEGFTQPIGYIAGEGIDALPTIENIYAEDGTNFAGWELNGNFVTSLPNAGLYGDITLVAKWGYKINYYESATSSVIRKTDIRAYDRDYTYTTWAKDGMTFAYWVDMDTNLNVSDTQILADTKASDSNLYPVWTYHDSALNKDLEYGRKYKITWDMTELDWDDYEPLDYYVSGVGMSELPNSDKVVAKVSDRSFAGWRLDNSPITSIPTEFTKDITLVGKSGYKINYYESATYSTIKKTEIRAYDEDYNYTPWTKDGKTFVYWVDKDTNLNVRNDGIYGSSKASDSNLYPVWTYKDYDVQPGDKVQLGTKDGQPITWIVLKVNNNNVELVSEKVIDRLSYTYTTLSKKYSLETANKDVEMRNKFFTAEESAQVIDIAVTNSDLPSYANLLGGSLAATGVTNNYWLRYVAHINGVPYYDYVNSSGGIQMCENPSTIAWDVSRGVRPWIKVTRSAAYKIAEYGREYNIDWNLGANSWNNYTPVTKYISGVGLSSLPDENKVKVPNGTTFAGWRLNGKRVDSVAKNVTGNITLYSKWGYKINYYEEVDSTVIRKVETRAYDENYVYVPWTKDGMNFAYWVDMDTNMDIANGTIIAANSKASESNVYPVWTKVGTGDEYGRKYKVTWDLQGADWEGSYTYPQTYISGIGIDTLPKDNNLIEKDNWSLYGWKIGDEFIASISETKKGNLTIKARKGYEVNYYNDSKATSIRETIIRPCDEDFTLKQWAGDSDKVFRYWIDKDTKEVIEGTIKANTKDSISNVYPSWSSILNKGTIVKFGGIDWIVLNVDKNNDKVLILSKDITCSNISSGDYGRHFDHYRFINDGNGYTIYSVYDTLSAEDKAMVYESGVEGFEKSHQFILSLDELFGYDKYLVDGNKAKLIGTDIYGEYITRDYWERGTQGTSSFEYGWYKSQMTGNGFNSFPYTGSTYVAEDGVTRGVGIRPALYVKAAAVLPEYGRAYDITWDLNGADWKNFTPEKTYVAGEGLATLPDGSKLAPYSDFIFDGWSLNGKKITSIDDKTSGKITIKAVWKYKVTYYESVDTTVVRKTDIREYDVDYDVASNAPDFKKDGLNIVYWVDKNTMDDVSVISASTLATNSNLYPVWGLRKPINKIGDIVEIGSYSQVTDPSVVDPVKWIVLRIDNDNDKALLISKDILRNDGYFDGLNWLQNTFSTSAFNSEEKAFIDGDLFILNDQAEYETYFAKEGEANYNAFVYESRKAHATGGTEFGEWWIKYKADGGTNVARYIGSDGGFNNKNYANNDTAFGTKGIRPLMWVKISKYLADECGREYKINWDLGTGKWNNNYEPVKTYLSGTGLASLPEEDKLIPPTDTTFTGWKINGKYETSIPTTSKGHVTVTAQWGEFNVYYYEEATSETPVKTVPRAYIDEFNIDVTPDWTKPGYRFAYWVDKKTDMKVNHLTIKSNTLATSSYLYPVWYDESKTVTRNVGDTILFGTYPQDTTDYDKTQDIEWIILEKTADKALLVSKKLLEKAKYNDANSSSTFETLENTTLGSLLTKDFYDKAFNDNEKSKILTHRLSLYDYHTTNKNVDMKVFLLNKDEAVKYKEYLQDAEPTTYMKNGYTGASYGWWLVDRSPKWPDGANARFSYMYEEDDSIGEYENKDVYGVRPAIWVSLDLIDTNVEYGRRYKVSYDISNEHWTGSAPTNYYISGVGMSTLPNGNSFTSPANWSFTDWKLNNVYVKSIEESVTGNVTLVAKWNNHDFKEGDVVKFGRYNSKSIDWKIVGSDPYKNKILLFAKDIIKKQKYDSNNTGTDESGWEDSTIRSWLNGEFFEKGFICEARETVLVSTRSNTRFDRTSYITEDRVFLFNHRDVNTYLKNDSDKAKNDTWWLRGNYGLSNYTIACVNPTTGYFDNAYVGNEYGIRPAIWVDADKLYELYNRTYTVTYYESASLKTVKREDTRRYVDDYALDGEPSWTPEGYKFAYWTDKFLRERIPSTIESCTIATNSILYPVYHTIGVDIAVGDTVQFGKYPQSTKDNDTLEPIDWKVLEVKDDKVLLLADKILDKKSFDKSYGESLWDENQVIKTFLTDTFYNKAFSNTEKGFIIPTKVEETDESTVFILSNEELTNYKDALGGNLKTTGTVYAGTNDYWTRNMTNNNRGDLRANGRYYLKSKTSENGVRPAMWVTRGEFGREYNISWDMCTLNWLNNYKPQTTYISGEKTITLPIEDLLDLPVGSQFFGWQVNGNYKKEIAKYNVGDLYIKAIWGYEVRYYAKKDSTLPVKIATRACADVYVPDATSNGIEFALYSFDGWLDRTNDKKFETIQPYSVYRNIDVYTSWTYEGSEEYFGAYPQDSNDANSKQALRWIVIDINKKDNTVLLTTKNIVMFSQFHDQENQSLTYEDSKMRNYLNHDFLDKAFTTEQQSHIKTTEVHTRHLTVKNYDGLYTEYNDDEIVTNDKVFLLNTDEINKFGDFSIFKKGIVTPFAKSSEAYQHASTYYRDDDWWTLNVREWFVADSERGVGYVRNAWNGAAGFCASTKEHGVRPAIWADMDILGTRDNNEIIWALNGGSWNDDYTPQTTYTVEKPFSLPTADKLSRPGYSFDGWIINDVECDEVDSFHIGRIYASAKWRENTYEVRYYESKKSTTPIKTVTKKFSDNYDVDKTTTLTQEGFLWTGWADKETRRRVNSIGPNLYPRDVELYPRWVQTVTFGKYAQEYNSSTKQAIEWIPFEYDFDTHNISMITKDILAKKYFNNANYNVNVDSYGYVTVSWETSKLRSWLNGDFKNAAFTSAEQADLKEVENLSIEYDFSVKENDNGASCVDRNNVSDKVYILPRSKVDKFANDNARLAYTSKAVGKGSKVADNWWNLNDVGFWRYGNWGGSGGIWEIYTGINETGALYGWDGPEDDREIGIRPVVTVSVDIASTRGDINWVLNGGHFIGDYPTKYVVDEGLDLPTADQLEKPGFTFDHWEINNKPTTEISEMSTGTVTVVAKWNADPKADRFIDINKNWVSNDDDVIEGDINVGVERIKPASTFLNDLGFGDYDVDKVYLTDFDTTGLTKIQTIRYTSSYRRPSADSRYLFEYNNTRRELNAVDVVRESDIRAEVWYSQSTDKFKIRLRDGENKLKIYTKRYATADVEYHAVWDFSNVNNSIVADRNLYYNVIYLESKTSNTVKKTVKVSQLQSYTFETTSNYAPSGYMLCYWVDADTKLPIYKVSPFSRTTDLRVYPVWQRLVFSNKDIVAFGRFAQSSTNYNNKEPIEWQVIDTNTKNGTVLLLSKKVLFRKPYSAATWQDSAVRSYLNTTFYNDAFTTEERGAIVKTRVNPKYTSVNDPETEDKIFMLNMDQSKKYLKIVNWGKNKEAAAANTKYAESNGGVGHYFINAAHNLSGRSDNPYRESIAGGDGTSLSFFCNYSGWGRNTTAGVRPAMWVNVEYVEAINHEAVKSAITWDLGGGRWRNHYPAKTYVEGLGLEALPTENHVYRANYKFVGWKLNNNLVTSISDRQTGRITLVAEWEFHPTNRAENSYVDLPASIIRTEDQVMNDQITTGIEAIKPTTNWLSELGLKYKASDIEKVYAGNLDPTGLTKVQEIYYKSDYRRSADSGYQFKNASGVVRAIDELDVIRETDVKAIVYYDKDIDKYKVNLLDGDGSVNIVNLKKGTDNTEYLVVWDLSSIANADTTTEIRYQITWDKNGGDWYNFTPETEYVYGKGLALPTNDNIKKEGSTLLGWMVDGKVVSRISRVDSGAKHAKAVWKTKTKLDKSMISEANGHDGIPYVEMIKLSKDNWVTELGLNDFAGQIKVVNDDYSTEGLNEATKFVVEYYTDYRTDNYTYRSGTVTVEGSDYDPADRNSVSAEVIYDEMSKLYVVRLLGNAGLWEATEKNQNDYKPFGIFWDLSELITDEKGYVIDSTEYTMPNTWYETFGFETEKNDITSVHFVTTYDRTASKIEEKTIKATNGATLATGVIETGNVLYVYPQTGVRFSADSDASNFFGRTAKGIFSKATSIDGLDVIMWDNVTNMSSMFAGAEALTSLDVSNLKTSKVTNMSKMFENLRKVSFLDLSKFNVSNVTNMSYMFDGMVEVNTIYVANDNFNVNHVTNSAGMFRNVLDIVGGQGTTYDENHIDKEYARIDKFLTTGVKGYFSEIGVEKISTILYPITWELDDGRFVNDKDKVDAYAYGVGLKTLPSATQVVKDGYKLTHWTMYVEDEEVTVASISTTTRGPVTLYAHWDRADISEDLYVLLPESIISNADGASDTNYVAYGQDVIKPTKEEWIDQLSLGLNSDSIEEVKIGSFDTTGLTKVRDIYYRTNYRRSETPNLDITRIDNDKLKKYSASSWDPAKETRVKAEIWKNNATDRYKIRLLNGNEDGYWFLSNEMQLVRREYEMIWDLTDVLIESNPDEGVDIEEKEDKYVILPKEIIYNQDGPFTNASDVAKEIMKPTATGWTNELGLNEYSGSIAEVKIGRRFNSDGLKKIQTIYYSTNYRRTDGKQMIDADYNAFDSATWDPVKNTNVKAEVWYGKSTGKYFIKLIDGNTGCKYYDKDNTVAQQFDYKIEWDLSTLDKENQPTYSNEFGNINWYLHGANWVEAEPFSSYRKGVKTALPAGDNLERAGYKFEYWYMYEHDAETLLPPEAINGRMNSTTINWNVGVSSIPATATGVIYLHASWSEIVNPTTPEDPKGPTKPEGPTGPTKPDDPDKPEDPTDDDINKEYEITWELDGGDWYEYEPKYNYTYGDGIDTEHFPTKYDVYKEDYTFVNWTLNGNPITSISKEQKGAITIRANWTYTPPTAGVTKYPIKWNLDGGNWRDKDYEEIKEYTYGTGLESKYFPTSLDVFKDGYTFTKWTIGGVDATSISSTQKGKVEILANWSGNTHGSGNTEVIEDDETKFFTLPENIISNRDDEFSADNSKAREIIKPTKDWAVELGLTGYLSDYFGLYEVTQNETFEGTGYTKLETIRYKTEYRRDVANTEIINLLTNLATSSSLFDPVKLNGVKTEVWYDSTNKKYFFNVIDGKNPSDYGIISKDNHKTHPYEIVWDLSGITENVTLTNSWYEDFGFNRNKADITSIHFVDEYNSTKRELESKVRSWNINGGSYTRGVIDEDRALYVITPKTTHIAVGTNASNFFGNTRQGTFRNVTTIDGLDKLDWSEVTLMQSMFAGAETIETLDLSSLDTSSATDMSFMFSGMTNLETIYVQDFNTTNVTNDMNMFTGLINIVGGEGTTYDKNHIDRTYARIDKKNTNNLPGYFTEAGHNKSYTRLEYNIYWELGEGNWKAGYDYPKTYEYGVGIPTLPTRSDATRSGYMLDSWALEDGTIIKSISTTQKGVITLEANWSEIIVTPDPLIGGKDYIPLPPSIISNKDVGAFTSSTRTAKEVITPSKNNWVTELGLTKYAGSIVEVGVGVDTTDFSLVETLDYKSDYRRKVTFDSRMITAHKVGSDVNVQTTDWDLIKDSEVTAEVYYDEVRKEYKINLTPGNGEWRVRAGGIDIVHEIEWDLSYIDIDMQSTTNVPAESYGITWTLNGGRWNPAFEKFDSYEYGKDTALPKEGDILKDDHKFLGWKLPSGIDIATISSTMRKDITLIANWKNNKFTAHLDANGGVFDDETSERNVSINGGDVIMFTEPTKKGYKFNGWSVRENGVDTALGNYWNYESGKTVTATWAPIKYKVIFDGNGAINPLEMAKYQLNMTYGEPQNTQPNLFIRDGYTFVCWTSTTGAVVLNGNPISTIGDYDGQTVVLRAVWTPKVTDTSLYLQDGLTTTPLGDSFVARLFGIGSNVNVNYGNFIKLEYVNDILNYQYAISGKKVLFWRDENNKVKFLGDTYYATTVDPYKATGSITAYVVRKNDIPVDKNGNPKTIKFDGAGGLVLGSKEVVEIPYIRQFKDFKDIEPTVSRPGFDFKGWLANGNDKFTLTDIIKNDWTVTATWEPKPYRFRYDSNNVADQVTNEGLIMGENKNKIVKSVEDLNFEHEGYDFIRWTTVMSGNTSLNGDAFMPGDTYDAVEHTRKVSSEVTIVHNIYALDRILYAQWDPLANSIMQSNGMQYVNPYEAVYGKRQKLKENTFTKAGNKFVGWANKPLNNEIVYTDRQDIDTLLLNEKGSYNRYENIMLYALWEPNDNVVPVVYKGNGGTVNGETSYAIYVRKNEGIRSIVAKKGTQVTANYIDINGNRVEFGKPLTKPTIIYADFGEGIQREVTKKDVPSTNIETVKKDIRFTPEELEQQLSTFGVVNDLETIDLGINSYNNDADDSKGDDTEGTDNSGKTDSGNTDAGNTEDTGKTDTGKTEDTGKTDDGKKDVTTDVVSDKPSKKDTPEEPMSGSVNISSNVIRSYASTKSGGGSTGGGGGGGGRGGAMKGNIQVAQNANAMPLISVSVTENRPANAIITPVNTASLDIKSVGIKSVHWTKDATTGKYKLSGYDKDSKEVKPVNTFCQIVGDKATDTYYFDQDGNMLTGWMKTMDGKWYYFNELKDSNEGKMAQGWTKIGNSWYYFNLNGSLLESGVTPDGETIGIDGKWVQLSTNAATENKTNVNEKNTAANKPAVAENISSVIPQDTATQMKTENSVVTHQNETVVFHTGENRFI